MYSVRPHAKPVKLLDKIAQWLTADRRPLVLFVGAGIVAFVFAYLMLGSGFISGNGSYWQNPRYDDNAHVSGWLYYEHDSWHLPVFDSQRMNYPDGASIIYTDSIPLVAVVAKVFRAVLPATWHYFGLFVIISYVGNCLALLWLLRQLRLTNLLGAVFAVVFACFNCFYNLQFESLFAHFFVILGLGFYFKLVRHYSHWAMGALVALVAASLLVHTYLFAMTLAVCAMTLVTLWHRKQITLKRATVWAASLAVSIGFLLLLSGIQQYKATGYQEALYGKSPAFALDVAQLFQKNYSRDEISMYIGLGAWILIVAGLVIASRNYAYFLKRHMLLVVLCAGLLLFALSNTIFLNGSQLLHVPLPAPLLGIFEMFRGSKRFIILLYYVAIVTGFVLLVQTQSKIAVALVLAALVTQVTDMQYFVRNLSATAHSSRTAVLDWPKLRRDMAHVTAVHVYPSYSCLFNYRKTPLSGQWDASLELFHLSAEELKVSNSVRSARRTKDCNQEARDARSMPPASMNVYLKDDNGLYILPPPQACLDQQKLFIYGMYCTLQGR